MAVLVEVLDVLHRVGLLHIDVSLKLHAEEGAVGNDVGVGDVEDHAVPDCHGDSRTLLFQSTGLYTNRLFQTD